MRLEDEIYIRETIRGWVKDSEHNPRPETYIDHEYSRNMDLEVKLRLANETIRSANKRIEELKSSKYSNPDFEIFGLDSNTAFIGLSEEEIQMVLQSTYRLRAKLNHPDSGGETENMKAINIAYLRLKDPNTRGNCRK